MPNLTNQVQPPLSFIDPAFNPIVATVVRSLLPAWLRWHDRVYPVEVTNAECLAQLYEDFQAGKVRFMLAFRHPDTCDPLCMGHLVWQAVPRAANRLGKALATPYAHFMYDRGIPLWAGKQVGWLYSRMGGTPIRRGKMDLIGLRSARHLFAQGRFPMALAPEGATNGHSEILSPIEPGIAQLGFWCVDDRLKLGRSEPVLIVPIGIRYHYVTQPWRSIERLLTQLELDSGIVTPAADRFKDTLRDNAALTPKQESVLYQRLYGLGEHLLLLMEQFYTKFYHQDLDAMRQAIVVSPSDQADSPTLANQLLTQRLQTLINVALKVAEDFFALSPKGSVTDRCRRIEQAGWDRVYRDDLDSLETLPLVERGLADRVAEEAALRVWHMRLVESFVSVTGRYVLEKPTVDRYAETLLLVWEMITRIKGNVPFPHPRLGRRSAHMTIGEPLSVSDRWQSYQTNRRQAVATLTQDLQKALEELLAISD
ncbi:MAG: 1-acyl-sn-glycerol-3-phosphate acyltransferase [Leptolyngbyaceae cyanobacterium SL_7_1]|nr:1-acyl-sn-glycerol-3-phosphate acyltransferase [Leptolyngbyaceae cyanobacterium SL_7_1]